MRSRVSKIVFALIFVCMGVWAVSWSFRGRGESECTQSNFVQIKDGQLVKDGKPYRFIGVNYWYGSLLGTPDGDRERLHRELDFMKEHGIDNLRVMVGVEGVSKNNAHASFPLQIDPGVYDDNLLDGLDYFMAEAGKRDIKVVLFLTNNWEWSGGYAQYLTWMGKGEYPYPNVAGWPAFLEYIGTFYDCEECIEAFKRHCEFIIGRTNRYTQQKYTDDPALMAWEIANEPRPNGAQNKEIYTQFIGDIAKHIKSLDSNHLLTAGTEGTMGTEYDIQLWKAIHSFPEVDYATIHIWAKNWQWIKFDNFDETFATTKEKMQQYIKDHAQIAGELNKPMVIEEIGFPRDGHSFDPATTTTYRDEYFDIMFNIMASGEYKSFQGINLWGFGGEGRAADEHYEWKPGDQFVGDPPQEEQGLNNIFDTDASTLKMIKVYNERLMKE